MHASPQSFGVPLVSFGSSPIPASKGRVTFRGGVSDAGSSILFWFRNPRAILPKVSRRGPSDPDRRAIERVDHKIGRVRRDALFYEFSPERHVPEGHVLSPVDRFAELGGLRREPLPFLQSDWALTPIS